MLSWTAPGRCLIAWDSGYGPTFAREGGEFVKRKAFSSFDVYRTADPADMTGILIGTTRAEAFLDMDAPKGAAVWYRAVGHVRGGGTYPVGARTLAIIPRRELADADTTPPSGPQHFKVRPRNAGNLLQWSASSDAESGLLAYFVYDSNQSQPDSVVWANEDVRKGSSVVRSFLDRTANEKKRYWLRAIDRALNLSDGPVSYGVAGWTVYTFKASSEFTLKAKAPLVADVLLVGGAGAGGGGLQGGGGGAGGFRDEHDVVLRAGENDGAVTVGAGGAPQTLDELAAAGHGNSGEPTIFGEFTAYGGGCGSSEMNDDDPPQPDVPGGYLSTNGADGASGGGGSPWGNPAVWVTDHYEGPGGLAMHGDQGHDGGHGRGYSAWYEITGGGGGGAHEPYKRDENGNLLSPLQPYFWANQFGGSQSLNPQHGGHGRPCDIRGWHMYEETAKQLMFVDWYGGGGAGKERKVWWGYANGLPGYGGAGDVFEDGVPNTGGGGGGTGETAYTPDQAPPTAGGSGIVVLRIQTCDEDLVAWPVITGTDPEATEFGLPVCLCDDPAVEIRRLPQYMTHTDESGDEQCPRTYEEVH